ncbi:ScyD/ScyE family protein [Miniimonas sp. S16]|uniref:ScyD/ScyE family protein n=1 Tax=Miniimonas sp. S16 TaxID=2171623 RepID=UPI000D5264BD|nr:ScyD/ScyE family protein [Miniimonas sp. S16]
MRRSLAAVAAIGGLLALAPAVPAAAEPTPTTVATGLAAPLSFGVDLDRTIYVAQVSFDPSTPSVLTRIKHSGARTDLATVSGELGAVSVLAGYVTYAETTVSEAGSSTLMKRLSPWGSTTTVADLGAAEARLNPDGGQLYGFVNDPLDEACAAEFEETVGAPAVHSGEVFSHPYGSVALPGLVTVVADAGANTVWRIVGGKVKPLWVLPPSPHVVTAEIAAALGAPDCVVGKEFLAEGVPTDIELGGDGMLYVTSLPGAPGESIPGAATVYKVNPISGRASVAVSGLFSASGLAIGRDGTGYVAEIFPGTVSSARSGAAPSPFLTGLDSPAAVEYQRGTLYVSTGAFGPSGAIVSVPVP